MYDAAKDAILASGRLGDGVPCHLAAALLAGVTATAVASPVDVVKTRCGDTSTSNIMSEQIQNTVLVQVYERAPWPLPRRAGLRCPDCPG